MCAIEADSDFMLKNGFTGMYICVKTINCLWQTSLFIKLFINSVEDNRSLQFFEVNLCLTGVSLKIAVVSCSCDHLYRSSEKKPNKIH